MKLICFLMLLALAPLAAHAQTVAATIPELHATALSGDKVDLPGVFQGKSGVLVVGFSQASRDPATAWAKRLSADYRDSNSVLYYEVSVLAGVPRLLRGYVVKKIAESVPDRAKPRFLSVYDHETDLRSLCGNSKSEDACVLLVDGTGTVRWKTTDAPTDATYAELRHRLEDLRK